MELTFQCLLDLQILKRNVKSTILCMYHRIAFDISSDINFCVGNKCLNGRCIDGFDSYTCDCTGTGYEGELCEQGI